MSYYMQIEREELTVKKGKTKEDVEDILEKIEFLPVSKCLDMNKCTILELEETSFNWDEAIYPELMMLSEICDGFMEITGEESEYLWYEIKDGVVKVLAGKIVYDDEPSLVFDAKNPILRKLLFDEVYSDDRIIVLNAGYKHGSYILVDRKEVRYRTFYSLTAGLLQLLKDYAETGVSTLEKMGWAMQNHDSIRSKELIDALAEKGFETEAVALKLAYQ